MVITYSLITVTLWRTIRPLRIQRDATSRRKRRDQESLATVSSGVQRTRKGNLNIVSNMERSLAQKKRVIKMLFVVVLEFFICWTPIHVINTVSLFNPRGVYGGLGYQGISFFHLLAYTSSCCNPITYCFMNSKFRQSFLSIFGCKNTRWHHQLPNSLSGTLRIASVSQRNFEPQRCFQETSIVVKNEDTV
ncbi:cholecystokinin receptor-like [Limulus polyphemus]|uniref:Cholecystokinin receptor-like n=1 Tax=Limulus polyphemus TaxID=6850 RepID=A0ABM1BZT3_LIMPO|nr:cholecystokinin receptor-like [Limulus polyphemus]